MNIIEDLGVQRAQAVMGVIENNRLPYFAYPEISEALKRFRVAKNQHGRFIFDFVDQNGVGEYEEILKRISSDIEGGFIKAIELAKKCEPFYLYVPVRVHNSKEFETLVDSLHGEFSSVVENEGTYNYPIIAFDTNITEDVDSIARLAVDFLVWKKEMYFLEDLCDI